MGFSVVVSRARRRGRHRINHPTPSPVYRDRASARPGKWCFDPAELGRRPASRGPGRLWAGDRRRPVAMRFARTRRSTPAGRHQVGLESKGFGWAGPCASRPGRSRPRSLEPAKSNDPIPHGPSSGVAPSRRSSRPGRCRMLAEVSRKWNVEEIGWALGPFSAPFRDGTVRSEVGRRPQGRRGHAIEKRRS